MLNSNFITQRKRQTGKIIVEDIEHFSTQKKEHNSIILNEDHFDIFENQGTKNNGQVFFLIFFNFFISN